MKNRGILLIDVLLAFTVSTLFITIMMKMSIDSRTLFESAKFRSAELAAYFSSTTIPEATRAYGNERQSLTESDFVKITNNTVANLADLAGIPLCSADFTDNSVVGSYSYFHSKSKNPDVSIKTINLPIPDSIPLTDLQVRNGIAYVSADSATQSDPDLYVVDLKNASIITSINSGPGLSQLTLAGRRIYSAAPSTAAQLHIIRFDALYQPIIENRYRLALPFATATPAIGSSIFFHKNLIFLATEKWDGDEFNILDVANPAAPVKISGIEIGSKVNDIYVSNDKAYIATADLNQLITINISNTREPFIESFFSPSGSNRQEGKSLDFFENILSFGRTSGGFNIASDHELFSDLKSVDFLGGIYGIVTDKKHVYVASRKVGEEFQVLDRNLSTTTKSVYALSAFPETVTCDNSSIYILGHLFPHIYEIQFK